MNQQADVLTISDLTRLKVVADPVRLSLLREFAEPRTIAEAANRIGFVGKGVYRHVDQLLGAGLLTVVSTRQKRGTVERTLQATAKRIVAVVSGEGPVGEVAGVSDEGGVARTETTARIDPGDLKDFEAAVVDLAREYENTEGVPVRIRLVAAQD